MPNIYNQSLEKNSANYQPLTPITFLERAASVYPERVAVIYGKQEYNYSGFLYTMSVRWVVRGELQMLL